VVDTAAFSLEGRAIRKVRQSVHRLEKAGYAATILRPSEIGPELRAKLESITTAWRGDQPERGFVMALDALFTLGDADTVFAVGLDPEGEPHGFLHFAVAPAISALSLSSMPRLRSGTPNGFNEWLICETIDWAREHGIARVSLNFSPFAALLSPEAQLSGAQELQRRALLRLKGRFQLDDLLAFNRKFFPEWERRFLVFERRRDLPRVGIAALAAESYLPFQAMFR
jgi:lysyl-tRNA synthetase class 2